MVGIAYRRRARTHDALAQRALSEAAHCGDAELLKQSLQHPGSNPAESVDSWHSCTVLHIVAGGGHADAVQVLLNDGRVDVNRKDAEGRTALFSAASAGHASAASLLLKCIRTNPQLADAGQRTPLFAACASGHDGVVCEFVKCERVELEKSDANGCTPFWAACRGGHIEIVKLLMGIGEDEENQKHEHEALNNDVEEGQDMLNEEKKTRRIDVNAASHNGCTPLRMACSHGHARVVVELLASGRVDVNAADGAGCTPIVLVCARGHEQLIDLLLSLPNVDLSRTTTSLRTPLHVAAANGHHGAVCALLRDARVPLALLDANGTTALDAAVEEGHASVIRLLINAQTFRPKKMMSSAVVSNDGDGGIVDGSEEALLNAAHAANSVHEESSFGLSSSQFLICAHAGLMQHAGMNGHADVVRLFVREACPVRRPIRRSLAIATRRRVQRYPWM